MYQATNTDEMNCIVAVKITNTDKDEVRLPKWERTVFGSSSQPRTASSTPIRVCVALSHFNTPPQSRYRPSALAKCFALMLGNALVNVLANISLVGQYTSFILPCLMIHRMK
jgi:hypothetical protein